MTKIQKYIKSIERSNSKFLKMTPAKQRVQIAKDVIAALKAKRLEAEHQTYLQVGGYITENRILENESDSFKDTLKTIPTCTVCAKGAIFTCTVARKNKVTNEQAMSQNWDCDSLSKSLKGTFSAHQLRLIETEFEDDDIDGFGDAIARIAGAREIRPVMELHELFNNAEDRMIAIMKNIIANKGTFKPKAPKDKSK